MVKCTECQSELKNEEAICPKCNKFTVITFEGTVVVEPEVVLNNSGENFIYFDVDTGERVVNCEIKQGYEPEVPLVKGDEVIVECKKFKERIVALRVIRLTNKRTKTLYNYNPGCLLPMLIFILIAVGLL